jgi:hypothetical protein
LKREVLPAGKKKAPPDCQRNHWSKHKKGCKQRAAELRDETLFKDPPPMEECPICFLPMPLKIISCASLPDATIMSVPIYDFAMANEELAKKLKRSDIFHVAERVFVEGATLLPFVWNGI